MLEDRFTNSYIQWAMEIIIIVCVGGGTAVSWRACVCGGEGWCVIGLHACVTLTHKWLSVTKEWQSVTKRDTPYSTIQ